MTSSWKTITRKTLPQYPLSTYGKISILNKADLKRKKAVDELIVAGYASPQVVDREKHIITKEALANDLPRFMAHPHYRNVNLLHSNVTVGEVLPSWTDPKSGKKWETKVDDVGLFTVIKIRNDPYRPPIVDSVIEDIKTGKIASFSISADAPFESRRHECDGSTCFWVIDEVVLYEITVCETPVNPDARFSILSKSFSLAGEYAASAFCKDGSCPITPRQASTVLKGYKSSSAKMLFEGQEDKEVEGATKPVAEVPKAPKAAKTSNPKKASVPSQPKEPMLKSEDIDEFDEGLEQESSEHYESVSGDTKALGNIVRDHLREDPRYYSKNERREQGRLDHPIKPAPRYKYAVNKAKIKTKGVKPTYGVSPKAPLADEDSEKYYLNLSKPADAFAGKEHRLYSTYNTPEKPKVVSKPIRRPKKHPLVSPDKMILRAMSESLENAIDNKKLNKSLEEDVRVLLSNFQKGEQTFYWFDNEWYIHDYYDSVPILFKRISKKDSQVGADLISQRLQKAKILNKNQINEMSTTLMKSADSLGISNSQIFKSDRPVKSNLVDLLDVINSSLMLGKVKDPLALNAIKILKEDAQSLLDGMELEKYVQLEEEPEHEVIEESGAKSLMEDVEETKKILENIENKSLEDKGGPENIPDEFKDRAIETSKSSKKASIAWFPKSGVLKEFGSNKENEIQMTLVTISDDYSKIDGNSLEKIKNVINENCILTPPLLGTLTDYGNLGKGDNKRFVVFADIPGLVDLRSKIVTDLEKEGISPLDKKGFIPHLDLNIDQPGMDDLEERGIPSLETTPITIDRLWLVLGEEKIEFSLDKGVGQVAGESPEQYKIKMNKSKLFDEADSISDLWKKSINDSSISLAIVQKNENGEISITELE